MSDTPSTHELARAIAAVDRRLDREYEQLRAEMAAGFQRLERAIESQQYVSPDLFRVDQLRQDDSIADVRGDVLEQREMIEQSWSKIGELRNQFVGGLLITLVVAAILSLVAP